MRSMRKTVNLQIYQNGKMSVLVNYVNTTGRPSLTNGLGGLRLRVVIGFGAYEIRPNKIFKGDSSMSI